MAGIAGQARLPATYGIRVKIFRQGSRSSKTYAFRKFDRNGVKSVTDLESILKKEFVSEIGTINSSCAEIGYVCLLKAANFSSLVGGLILLTGTVQLDRE